jgi:hypothetical protein
MWRVPNPPANEGVDEPTAAPTAAPSAALAVAPSAAPSAALAVAPVAAPSAALAVAPVAAPANAVVDGLTAAPTTTPAAAPSAAPVDLAVESPSPGLATPKPDPAATPGGSRSGRATPVASQPDGLARDAALAAAPSTAPSAARAAAPAASPTASPAPAAASSDVQVDQNFVAEREANIAKRKRMLEELGISKLASRLPGDHGRQPQPEVGEACAAPPRKRQRRRHLHVEPRLSLPRAAKKGADVGGYYVRHERELDRIVAEHASALPGYFSPAGVFAAYEEEEEDHEDEDPNYDVDADPDSGDDSNVDSDSDVDTDSDVDSEDEGPTLLEVALGLDADDEGDDDDAALFDDDDAPAFDADATVCLPCAVAEARTKARSRRRALHEKLKARCSSEELAEAESIRKASLEHVLEEEGKQKERYDAWRATHERAHPKPPEPTARTRTPDARGVEPGVEARLRHELEACPRTNAAVDKANAEVLHFRDDVFFKTDAETVAFFGEHPERRQLYDDIPASQVELPTAVIPDGGVVCTLGSFATAFATQPAPDTPFAVVPSSSSSSSPGRFNPSMDMTMRVIPERVVGWTRDEYRQRAAHIDLLLPPLPPTTNVRRFLRRFSDENPQGFEAFVVGISMLVRRLVVVLGGAHRVVPLVLAALRDDGDNVWTTFFAAALTVDAARDALAPLFATVEGMRAWLVCTNHPCNYLVAERMPTNAENVARADLALSIAFSFASGTFVACDFARGFLEQNAELAALMEALRRARYLARPTCERDGCGRRPTKHRLCYQHRRCEDPEGCGRVATAADRLCDEHGGRKRGRETCAYAECRRLATRADGLCNPHGGRRKTRSKTCAYAECRRLATRADGLCNPHGGRGKACAYAGCHNVVTRSGGLCNTHRGRRKTRSKTCAYAECRRLATRADGLCNPHGGRSKACAYAGCHNVATRAGGLCNTHGGRRKTCSDAGCHNVATRAGGLCDKHKGEEEEEAVKEAMKEAKRNRRAQRRCQHPDGSGKP